MLYPCLGYFLQYRLQEREEKRALPYLWAANILTIGISCYMTYKKGIAEGVFAEGQSQTFYSNFAMINAVTLFVTARVIFEEIRIPRCISSVISSLGACCFGIYLWHVFVLNHFGMWELCSRLKATGMNTMIAAWVMCFAVMIISYIITFIMSKIPIFKRLVGF